jgi:hypothetical protein
MDVKCERSAARHEQILYKSRSKNEEQNNAGLKSASFIDKMCPNI